MKTSFVGTAMDHDLPHGQRAVAGVSLKTSRGNDSGNAAHGRVAFATPLNVSKWSAT